MENNNENKFDSSIYSDLFYPAAVDMGFLNGEYSCMLIDTSQERLRWARQKIRELFINRFPQLSGKKIKIIGHLDDHDFLEHKLKGDYVDLSIYIYHDDGIEEPIFEYLIRTA